MRFSQGFGMNDFMFDAFPAIFGIIFILFIIVFVYSIAKSAKIGIKNSNSPKLNVFAFVVSKRMSVEHRTNFSAQHIENNAMQSHHSYTNNFVTFEVESGDRIEFLVSGNDYGIIVEGDCGELNFQGTRFLGFERKKNNKSE